jgi:hypothetical protein
MFYLALGKKGDKLSTFGVVLFSGAVSGSQWLRPKWHPIPYIVDYF